MIGIVLVLHNHILYLILFPPTSGTNWVGQIVTDLVITSAKKYEPEKLNEKLLLAEIPYLELGDTEKYKVSIIYVD